MTAEFRTYLITPRIDPETPGLSEFFQRIKAVRPQNRETRHILDSDLYEMHPHFHRCLRMMSKMGCIEWRISLSESDLPKE